MFRRPFVLFLFMLTVALAAAGTASASGQDVLRDYKDDGVLSKCYTPAEFTRGLELALNDTGQYQAAADVIREKQLECAGGTPAPAATENADEGGSNTALWAIVVGALAAGAVAFGVAARKRRDDEGA